MMIAALLIYRNPNGVDVTQNLVDKARKRSLWRYSLLFERANEVGQWRIQKYLDRWVTIESTAGSRWRPGVATPATTLGTLG